MIGGIALLRHAWRAPKRSIVLVSAGWALLVAALPAWSAFGGADRGVALGFIVFIFAAMVFVVLEAARTPVRAARKSPDRMSKDADFRPSPRVYFRNGAVVLLAGPVAGLSALAVTVLVFTLLNIGGQEITSNVVIGYFVFPLLWAVLAAFAAIDSRLWRKSILITGLGLASLAGLMVS